MTVMVTGQVASHVAHILLGEVYRETKLIFVK